MYKVYQFWCKYDVGQDDIVFSSPTAAWSWARNNVFLRDFTASGEYGSIYDMEDDGALTLRTLEFMGGGNET